MASYCKPAVKCTNTSVNLSDCELVRLGLWVCCVVISIGDHCRRIDMQMWQMRSSSCGCVRRVCFLVMASARTLKSRFVVRLA